MGYVIYLCEFYSSVYSIMEEQRWKTAAVERLLKNTLRSFKLKSCNKD